MANIKLVALLFLFFMAKTGMTQQMTEEKLVTRMMAEISRVFDATNIEIKSSTVRSSDQTSLLSGKCNFFNVTEIDFAATFDQGERIRSFSITVPLGQKFDGSKIQTIAKSGDYINLFLPKDVRNGLLLNKYTINFSETLAVTNVSMDMGLNTSIPFKVFGLPHVKINDLRVGYKIDNPLTSPAVSGKLGASLFWGETSFPFETILSRDPKNFAISVGIRNLTLNSVITNFGIPNDLVIPENVDRVLKIESAKLTMYPGAYSFVFEGGTPLGAVNFVVKRVTVDNKPMVEDTLSLNTSLTGAYSANPENPDPPPTEPKPPVSATVNKWGIMAGFQLPESSEEIPAVNIMRKAGLTNIGLVVSTIMDGGVETTLPIFANVGSGNTLIQRGFTFISWISVNDLLTKYYLTKPLRAFAPEFMNQLAGSMPIESVMFRANVPLTVTDISLEGDINFNERMQLIPTTDLIVLRQLKMILKPMSTSPEFSFGATWEMKIDPTRKDPLTFNANMFVKTDGTSITLGVDGSMPSSWENPYGYKGLSINSPKLKVGLSFSNAIIPIPDDLFFSGQMKYGQVMGDITLGVNYNELMKNMFVARICNLSLKNIADQWLGGLVNTELTNKKNIYKQLLDEALNIQLKDAYLKVVPPMAPAELMSGLRLENDYTKDCPKILTLENTFLPGVRMAAAGEFVGWKGMFDIGAEGSLSSLSGGMTVKANMDPIKLSSSGFKIFHLTGYKENDPFQLYFDLSTNSLINGVKGLLSDPNASKSATGFVNSSSPFYIKAVHSNKLIDITGAGMNYGIMAIQAAQTNATSQQFVFDPYEEGYYTIRNVNSQMNLDVQNGVANNGQPVWQYIPNTTPAQLFKLVPRGNGNYSFESKLNPSMVLEIGAANGAQLKLANRSTATNQQFQLIPVEQTGEAPSLSDRIFYLSGAVTILDVAQAKTLADLTPTGYKLQARGKIYKVLDGTIDATIGSFRNILTSSHVKGNLDIGVIQQKIMNALSTRIGDIPFFNELKKGFVIKSITFGGNLEGLQSNVNFKVVFKVAGQSFSPSISLTPGEIASGVDAFADKIARLVKTTAGTAIDFAKNTFNDAIRIAQETTDRLKQTAVQTTQKAIDLAKNTSDQVISLKNNLTSNATTAFNSTKGAFNKVGEKTQQFFKDLAGYSTRTVEKLYNKSVNQISNGWDGFTDGVKKVFTGGDNEERVMKNGPAFRIITRYQNQVLASTGNSKKNFPVVVKPRTNSYLETWQLAPNDTEGSFFLVSGFSGLLAAKPWESHLILIPHESNHKKRERMMMVAVPNEPGWFYLRYHHYDSPGGIPNYCFAEVKNVVVNGVSQMVLAPVYHKGNARPGDYGKFRFEKAGDIDWKVTKSFPPSMTPATALVEGNRYQFNGEPEQYIYSNGTFRWIPSMETLIAMNFNSRPHNFLPNNQQVSTVLGEPFPMLLNGSLVQAKGQPAVFIIENGKKRWIPDIETFNMMALNWEFIQNISLADLNAIPMGEEIPSKFIPKNILMENALYRKIGGDGTVYIVLNKTLRPILNPATLYAMGYDFPQVIDLPADHINTLPIGAVLPNRENNMLIQVNGRPEVYIMSDGIRRLLPDPETFNALMLDWNKIQKISLEDMNRIPLGPAMLSLK